MKKNKKEKYIIDDKKIKENVNKKYKTIIYRY